MTAIYAGIITRLRLKCPLFAGRVAGTAMFESLSKDDGTDLAMPAAFVVPLHETAEPRTNVGEYHRVHERFGVIVAASNAEERQDGLGMIAMDLMRTVRQQLLNALMPWSPLPHYDNIQYVGARHLTMSRVRLWRQFEWQTSYMVSYDTPPDPSPRVKDLFTRANPDAFPTPPGYDGYETLLPESRTTEPPHFDNP